MPYKDPIKQKEAQHQHYIDKKQEYRDRFNARRANVKDIIDKYKTKTGCFRCKENYSRCLQFHHIDPSKKHENVSYMINYGTSLKRIWEEIDKCILLCANCHVKEHDGIFKES